MHLHEVVLGFSKRNQCTKGEKHIWQISSDIANICVRVCAKLKICSVSVQHLMHTHLTFPQAQPRKNPSGSKEVSRLL